MEGTRPVTKQNVNKADFLNADHTRIWDKLQKLTNSELNDLFNSLNPKECLVFADNLKEDQLAIIFNQMHKDVFNKFYEQLDEQLDKELNKELNENQLKNNEMNPKEEKKDNEMSNAPSNSIEPSNTNKSTNLNIYNAQLSSKIKSRAAPNSYNFKKIFVGLGTLAVLSGLIYLIYKFKIQNKETRTA